MSLTKIIIHWTAGTGLPNAVDRTHYHYLIDENGKVSSGKFKPEDNINCVNDRYAAHTGGGNTGAIGVTLCGMLGYKSPQTPGDHPLNEIQCEAAFKLVAELCKKYGIPVTHQTVMTHYEFGAAHPKTTSYGKIDITYLPDYPGVIKEEMGDFIRNKVKWYLDKI